MTGAASSPHEWRRCDPTWSGPGTAVAELHEDVTVIVPDEASIAALGSSPLDPRAAGNDRNRHRRYCTSFTEIRPHLTGSHRGTHTNRLAFQCSTAALVHVHHLGRKWQSNHESAGHSMSDLRA